MIRSTKNKVISFSEPIDFELIPDEFPSPFLEEPNGLAQIAARQLVSFLEYDEYWQSVPLYQDLRMHRRIGKMFGVLVVKDEEGSIGFLAAFSGKLLGENIYDYFVPPVFDMLEIDGFYRQEEQALLELSKQIKTRESSPEMLKYIERFKIDEADLEKEWEHMKRTYSNSKSERSQLKKQAKLELSDVEYKIKEQRLIEESIQDKYAFKKQRALYKQNLVNAKKTLNAYKASITDLKIERKARSKALQEKLYAQYAFLNKNKEFKDLKSIFINQDIPPSGSGECAAPKLLHYAFLNNLKPLCMAEFWWGRSPNSNQKIQGEFYPPCDEKCRPILKHMLKDL